MSQIYYNQSRFLRDYVLACGLVPIPVRGAMRTKILKSTLRDWLKVLILLLDEAVVVVLVILALHFFEIRIPLSVTIPLALVAGIFVFILHVAVIPSFHKKQVTGREGMLGLQGKVVEQLRPSGVVTVQGEYWKAKSVDSDADNNIEIDEDVEIVGTDGLTLLVKRVQN